MSFCQIINTTVHYKVYLDSVSVHTVNYLKLKLFWLYNLELNVIVNTTEKKKKQKKKKIPLDLVQLGEESFNFGRGGE